ncbi:MAG: hypothetical protein PWQ77_2268 [Kosmotogales bacterium]|nr:hypothetical protein [Kosmotogales bacterium]
MVKCGKMGTVVKWGQTPFNNFYNYGQIFLCILLFSMKPIVILFFHIEKDQESL